MLSTLPTCPDEIFFCFWQTANHRKSNSLEYLSNYDLSSFSSQLQGSPRPIPRGGNRLHSWGNLGALGKFTRGLWRRGVGSVWFGPKYPPSILPRCVELSTSHFETVSSTSKRRISTLGVISCQLGPLLVNHSFTEPSCHTAHPPTTPSRPYLRPPCPSRYEASSPPMCTTPSSA